MNANLACLAVAAFLGLAAPAIAGPRDGVAVCGHYENRARFKSRVEGVEFVTVLAEACGQAVRAAASEGTPIAERVAAVAFLETLGRARSEIDGINRARMAARPLSAAVRFKTLPMVTPTGEYLILRAEGVFGALANWVDNGGDFMLAGVLPR